MISGLPEKSSAVSWLVDCSQFHTWGRNGTRSGLAHVMWCGVNRFAGHPAQRVLHPAQKEYGRQRPVVIRDPSDRAQAMAHTCSAMASGWWAWSHRGYKAQSSLSESDVSCFRLV